METFTQTAPERLEIRSGGGCLSVFGVPFLAAGLFILLMGLGVIEPENAEEVPDWGWLLILLMGAVFSVVGGSLVFGRSWITLDASQGTVTRQWGLLVPMKVEQTLLQEFNAVVLSFQAGDSDSSDRYPVALERTSAGGKEYALCSATEYASSRERAEQIARLLGIPLKDRTTDHETVLDPGALSQSYRERGGVHGGGQPSRPPVMHSRVEESPTKVTISIPGRGFRPRSLVRLVIPVAILWWVASELLPFFDRTGTPETVRWVVLVVAALVLLLPLAHTIVAIFASGRVGTTMVVSPRGIRIEERSPFRTRTTEVPASAILDIDYGTRESAGRASARDFRAKRDFSYHEGGSDDVALPTWARWIRRLARSKGVIVKARTGLVTFGGGLPDDEVTYLHALVARTLGSG